MPSTLEFLKSILPSDGWKCAAILRNGKMHQEWTEDLGQLELILLSADEQGGTAYHGCASYRTRGSRKQGNAQGARSFWLDVDAGPTKFYPDTVGAYRAAETFRAAANLPPPLYVRSGAHGLHIYWPLAVPLSPDEWLAHAQGLKALCKQHGLQADPTRTADIASILRPPGTHNRKSGEPVEVVCGPLVGPYELREFAHLLGGMAAARGAAPGAVLPRAKQHEVVGLSGQLAASLKEAFERKSYVSPLVTQCRQIARVSTSTRSGTRLPEPLWHAALGVLAYAIGGDTAAREYAKGYDGHPEAATSAWVQAKLDRARIETTGPTTCQRFADLDAAGCAGCPFIGKITSPIVLGYEDEHRVETVPGVGVASGPVHNHVLPDLPSDYQWSGTGQLVFVGEKGPKGAVNTIVLSEYPLYLESIGTSEIETDIHSYNFTLVLPRGTSTITLPAKNFMGPDGIGTMFSKGAVIHDRDLFRKYVMSAADMFNRNTEPVTRYEQFGWKDEETAFLWGRSLYTGSNVLPAAAVDEVATRGKLLNSKPGGSLARWTAAANRLFARDCEPHAFALLCSFAAPLMRFHSTDEGGAILCLVGPPGSGKSTALDAAGSVWGQHRALDLNTFDTRAARGVNLGVLGNLPVIYDEMEKQDVDVLREFVAIFTNGRDRARATVDGGIRHEARTWQTIVVGAANRSVVELVAGRDDSEALSSRILEFPGHLPKGMSDGEATALRNELKMNSGYAADLYVRYLVQPEVVKWMRETLIAKTEEVWKRTGLTSEHRFWVRTIGSVWVASLLVEKAGLLAFSPQRLVDWAIEQKTGVAVNGETKAQTYAISVLSEYLNEHIGDTVVVPGPFHPGRGRITPVLRPMRRLVIRCEMEPRRFLVAEKPFKDWLTKHGISPAQVFDDLRKAFLVIGARPRLVTLGAGTDIPGGQIMCLEVNGQHPMLSGVLAPVEVLQASMQAQRR